MVCPMALAVPVDLPSEGGLAADLAPWLSSAAGVVFTSNTLESKGLLVDLQRAGGHLAVVPVTAAGGVVPPAGSLATTLFHVDVSVGQGEEDAAVLLGAAGALPCVVRYVAAQEAGGTAVLLASRPLERPATLGVLVQCTVSPTPLCTALRASLPWAGWQLWPRRALADRRARWRVLWWRALQLRKLRSAQIGAQVTGRARASALAHGER